MTALRAGIEAALIALHCDAPSVRLHDANPRLASELEAAGIAVDAGADVAVFSGRAPAADDIAQPTTRRVLVFCEPSERRALEKSIEARGFHPAGAVAADSLLAVTRDETILSHSFWDRVLSWVEADEALRRGVVFGEILASRVTPARYGARTLLIFDISAPRGAPSTEPPASAGEVLARAGLDLSAATAAVRRMVEEAPMLPLLATFVVQTVEHPLLTELALMLFPDDVARQMREWLAGDALDRDVGAIARTWHECLIAPDVLRYRGIDLGFTTQLDAAIELIKVLYFEPRA